MTDRPPTSAARSRTVLITGAGRGLGLGLARHLAARGHRVVGTVRRPDAAAELEAVGARVEVLDVTSDASIDALAASVADLGHLDVLINNAGIDARTHGAARTRRGPFDLDRAAIVGVLEVNVAGPMLVTGALLRLLRRADRPVIVNVSSQLGSMSFGREHGLDTSYNASKAALNMVTARTAQALDGDGMTVVSLHPGWVQTDMGGPTAALTIDESAGAIADTVERLGPGDNGRFLRWDGADHEW